MIINDLRDWIDAVRAIDQLKCISGAETKTEIGGIVDWFQEEMGTPALLFNDIPGYPAGYMILANTLISKERIALTLGLDPKMERMDIVKYWRQFLRENKRVPTKVVVTGKVMENIQRGADVDLTTIPTPVWHELDGGPYIGTGCLVVQRDPDSGWVNVGCYRVQTFDRNSLGIMMTAGRHGNIIMEKYWQRGEPCPVAVVVGQHPLFLLVAGMQVPWGVSEFEVAGAVWGKAVEVIKCPETGLPVPADSEIVIEGTITQGDLQDEGPFGEWTGYYASGVRAQPVIRVQSMMYRNDPILLGTVPRRPPNDDQYATSFLGSAAIWNEVESAGIEGICGVWGLEASGGRMFTVVSMKQLYPGHAKQVLMSAASCHSGTYANRYTVVVDEDIDPTDINAVVWAMCTRVDPREDMDIIHRGWSSPLDPMSYPDESKVFNSRVLIDACRPWEKRHTFPKVAEASPALRKLIIDKWGYLKS